MLFVLSVYRDPSKSIGQSIVAKFTKLRIYPVKYYRDSLKTYETVVSIMEESGTIFLLSLAMLVGCYLAGSIPLAFSFSEVSNLNTICNYVFA